MRLEYYSAHKHVISLTKLFALEYSFMISERRVAELSDSVYEECRGVAGLNLFCFMQETLGRFKISIRM